MRVWGGEGFSQACRTSLKEEEHPDGFILSSDSGELPVAAATSANAAADPANSAALPSSVRCVLNPCQIPSNEATLSVKTLFCTL